MIRTHLRLNFVSGTNTDVVNRNIALNINLIGHACDISK